MVEVAGTGDESVSNNTMEESRCFLATIVSVLSTFATMIYNWFLAIYNRLFTMMQEHPMQFIMFITNLAIVFF